MMTKERAEEIRQNIMAAHGWSQVGRDLTAEEDAEVRRFWNTLPGNTSFYDAVCRMARGEHLTAKQSLYGGWPMVRSQKIAGELAIQCPKCYSQDIVLGTDRGAFGTGPDNRWRMGDRGGREYAQCRKCGNKAYHVKED